MDNHTFVICAYGESQYLEACVLSIVKQSVKEKIVIATSTINDHILGIGKKYNIEILPHSGGSIGKDWNFGYECANSKYVTLVHQDDIYHEKYLEKMLAAMDKNKDTLISFSNYEEIRNNEIVSKNKNLKIKEFLLSIFRISNKNKMIRRRALSMGNPICCPTVTYNKSLLENFRFHMEFSTNLDWAAWEQISQYKGRFIYLSETLMYHRIHAESETSNTINNNKRSEEDLLMLKKFWPSSIAQIIFYFYKKSEKANSL
ncbi:glycosyltransferase family 2 protein [Acetobacterium bakii]|uniref:Glycosyltransferase 2-like domain-containing protein n=1 Tax=Acetobacterium bakii TaxID=52689 RepID=A0A0L6U3I1_9FIRM|nr:glycosyltransferase [Acetobacterium bakii]KNZ43078.1 hypothetical protein AKG39_02675 [Acetobacterium bakii]